MADPIFAFENGVTVRDVVTGLSGVVTGRVNYLTGCNQYMVQPPVDDQGKPQDCRWFDETRLVDSGVSRVVLPGVATDPGGPGNPGELPPSK